MKSIANTFEKIGDSLNPIVVKEVRQAVHGKFLVVVLMLFLVVQLFAMGISLVLMRVFSASGITFSSFSAGRTIFTVLLGILSATAYCLSLPTPASGWQVNAQMPTLTSCLSQPFDRGPSSGANFSRHSFSRFCSIVPVCHS